MQLRKQLPCEVLPREKTNPLTIVKVFRGLRSDAVQQLAQHCRWRQYQPKTVILQDGKACTEVFFVLRGAVQVTYHSEYGREVTFAEYREGDLFGDLAINNPPRLASVISLIETSAAIMSSAHFHDVVRENNQVAGALIASLAETIRVLEKRVIEMSTRTVQQRIYAELLRLARQSSPTEDGKGAIILSLPTHADIASRVSTHREAVTRALNELARQGLIEKQRRRMIVRDLNVLSLVVDQV